MIPSMSQVIILLVIIFLTVVPPVLVIASRRSQGGAKFGWFIAAVLFSWIAYIVFLIVTRDQKNHEV